MSGTAAVAALNPISEVISTGLTPKVSTSRPTKGWASARERAPTDSASEMSPRLQANAPASGFIKTPTLIKMTDVEQHIVPSIAIQTMNQAIRRNFGRAPAAWPSSSAPTRVSKTASPSVCPTAYCMLLGRAPGDGKDNGGGPSKKPRRGARRVDIVYCMQQSSPFATAETATKAGPAGPDQMHDERRPMFT